MFHAAVFRENMDACLADGADQSADQKRQGMFSRTSTGVRLILHGFVKFTTDFHMQPSFAEKYVQFSGNYTGMFHVKHFETDCCFTERHIVGANMVCPRTSDSSVKPAACHLLYERRLCEIVSSLEVIPTGWEMSP
ncbi:MAG: hypothetical protein ACLR5S_11985 [Ruminococcus sp.]